MIILFFAHTQRIPLDDFDDMERLIEKRNNAKWLRLTEFLRTNHPNITEFRISVKSDNEFLIHPLNTDGETIDFKING